MSDPLFRSGVGARRIPCRRQVAGKRHQRGAIDLGTKRRGDIMPSDAVLDMGDPLQRRVPPSFEFARNQPFGRIDDLIATGSQCGFVTRFLELPAERLSDLIIAPYRLTDGLDCGFDRVLRNGVDDLRGDGAIDPDTANTDA